jgi:hypothetical protein
VAAAVSVLTSLPLHAASLDLYAAATADTVAVIDTRGSDDAAAFKYNISRVELNIPPRSLYYYYYKAGRRGDHLCLCLWYIDGIPLK